MYHCPTILLLPLYNRAEVDWSQSGPGPIHSKDSVEEKEAKIQSCQWPRTRRGPMDQMFRVWLAGVLWQNPTTITDDISGNICPCFLMNYVCNLLLYNTSSSFKSVSSDSAKHREQDCVSISTIIFTFLLLFLVQFRSWTIAIKKFQRTAYDSLFCHYNNEWLSDYCRSWGLWRPLDQWRPKLL